MAWQEVEPAAPLFLGFRFPGSVGRPKLVSVYMAHEIRPVATKSLGRQAQVIASTEHTGMYNW